MVECVEYVARAEAEDGGLFAHQSEHASFQIVTPKATIRLSHGRLHQIAMRDPTDQYDLPDHLTWQMNMAVHHSEVSHAYHAIHLRSAFELPPRLSSTVLYSFAEYTYPGGDSNTYLPKGLVVEKTRPTILPMSHTHTCRWTPRE